MQALFYLDNYIKKNIFDKLDLDPPMSVTAVNDYYANTIFTHAHQFPFDPAFRDAANNLGWAATSDPTINGGSGGLGGVGGVSSAGIAA